MGQTPPLQDVRLRIRWTELFHSFGEIRGVHGHPEFTGEAALDRAGRISVDGSHIRGCVRGR